MSAKSSDTSKDKEKDFKKSPDTDEKVFAKRDPDQPVDDLGVPPPEPIETIGGRINPDDLPEHAEVPEEPVPYTATLLKPGKPDEVENSEESYIGKDPRLVLINPLASIQENAKTINEKLIKQCLKSNLEYQHAYNILRYALRTLGHDWVAVRDEGKKFPEIKKSDEAA